MASDILNRGEWNKLGRNVHLLNFNFTARNLHGNHRKLEKMGDFCKPKINL